MTAGFGYHAWLANERSPHLASPPSLYKWRRRTPIWARPTGPWPPSKTARHHSLDAPFPEKVGRRTLWLMGVQKRRWMQGGKVYLIYGYQRQKQVVIGLSSMCLPGLEIIQQRLPPDIGHFEAWPLSGRLLLRAWISCGAVSPKFRYG